MKKKMMKAIKELNAYIDNDREKLCDELHELKLSHKRMENLLRLSFNALKNYRSPHWSPNEILKLMVRIHRELSYPYYRVNYKMKGVKKCVDV